MARLPLSFLLFLCSVYAAKELSSQTADAALDSVIADELKEQFGEDFLSDDELNELLGDDFTDEVLEDPNWDVDLKLRSGLGYGDNVLFGAFEQVASSYFIGSLDGLVYRLPDDGEANAYLYVYAEHLEYFEDWTLGACILHKVKLLDRSINSEQLGSRQLISSMIKFLMPRQI